MGVIIPHNVDGKTWAACSDGNFCGEPSISIPVSVILETDPESLYRNAQSLVQLVVIARVEEYADYICCHIGKRGLLPVQLIEYESEKIDYIERNGSASPLAHKALHAVRKTKEWIEGRTGIKYRRRAFNKKRPTLFEDVGNRDGFYCKKCGEGRDLTLDHILPIARGGDDSLGNLQILCRICNSEKGIS